MLYTGKGGVGKTTTAAAAAVGAARRGRRALVISADAAHIRLVTVLVGPCDRAGWRVKDGPDAVARRRAARDAVLADLRGDRRAAWLFGRLEGGGRLARLSRYVRVAARFSRLRQEPDGTVSALDNNGKVTGAHLT